MATVPDSVLRWLYNSLRAEYHDVDRTYSDAAQVLSQYASLAPRTEVHTFENGAAALLLVLQGTLPVHFRGTTYRFPIAVWLPHGYPREPPMIFVTPTREMSIRPGQHVSVEGKVYHPYLAHWNASNLDTFLTILSDVFSKEPPVVASQGQPPAQTPGHRPAQPPAPPPVPIQPIGLRQPPYPPQTASPQQSKAPAPPPKPQRDGLPASQNGPRGSSTAPPLPPKPGQPPSKRKEDLQPSEIYASPSSSRAGRDGPPLPPLPHEIRRQERDPKYPPQSPGTPGNSPYPLNSQHQQKGPPGMTSPQPPSPYHYKQPPPQNFHQQRQPPQRQYQQPQRYPSGPPQQPPPLQQQQQPKQPQPDLISSPLDTTAATPQSLSSTTIPAPPIPLNPEKDRLLSLISSSLHPLLTTAISQTTSALPALNAQQTALQTFHHALTAELAQLQTLDATLSSNENILHAALRDTETIERGLSRRELPGVDDVLVAPTVVGEQLYGLVAEERGIADALFVLGRALDGGRVSGEVFVRQTRGLAREQFLKRALARKIARGMGLSADAEERW